MRWLLALTWLILAAIAPVAPLIPLEAHAVQPEEMLQDPALEARAREISKGLRCVVCQNQSIDDSDASIAGDMRKMVRARLLEGDTDDQVRDRLVTAYGEYVLLSPRFTWANAAIWAAPAVALALGGLWLTRRVRRDAAPTPDAAETPRSPALSDDERARLARLLDE